MSKLTPEPLDELASFSRWAVELFTAQPVLGAKIISTPHGRMATMSVEALNGP